MATRRPGFSEFYRSVFLPEHRHPANVALHVAGTLAGLAFVPAVLLAGLPWLLFLFPMVHAAPGLVGHRLFERNAAVGDLRVTRTDHSPLWFIVANHRLTWQIATRRYRRA